MRRLLALPLAGVLCTLVACGLGPGEVQEGNGARLSITRDFGQRELGGAELEAITERDSAMSLLRKSADVDTEYGGRFVQAIDGLEGGGSGGNLDWFFWVNGAEGVTGAAEQQLAPGDVVQWDYRDWQATMSIPAIVGAYPEPFAHGLGGDRLPIRVECGDPDGAACDEVKGSLEDAGALAPGAALGAGGGKELLRVIVGPWSELQELRAAEALAEGPRASGVFARPAPTGIELLDRHGESSTTLGAGSGLIAATVPAGLAPTWFVTGVDEAGVEAAAGALDAETLRDAFAVAIEAGGQVTRLPVAPSPDRP
ncbi:MAG: DUF4430 domain-containing protein [Thermoleophilaceae bacterium]|nr:DUF4430 domain-containing protein [Thermoleophilaceae bacterium]